MQIPWTFRLISDLISGFESVYVFVVSMHPRNAPRISMRNDEVSKQNHLF